MAETTNTLLECRATAIGIAGIRVVEQLDMRIEPGQCWCVLGKNGIGKTTLLHTLAGLRAPRTGVINARGQALDSCKRRQLARHIGILFQDQEDSFPATVLDTVLQGRHPYLRPWQWESAADIALARRALALAGLEGFEQRDVQSLSGGERQRAAIATLVAQDTPLLLLDEPTNHLDLHHSIAILTRLLAYCRSNGKSMLMVVHDINLAARFADRALLLLGDGEYRIGPAHDVMQTAILERLFGHALIAVETSAGRAWLPA